MLDFQATRWLIDKRGAEAGRQQPPDHRSRPASSRPPTATSTSPSPARRSGSASAALDRPRGSPRPSRLRQRGAALEEPRRARDARSTRRSRSQPSQTWIDRFNEAGVPCGPINAIDEVFADPQVRHLGIAQSVTSGKLGDITLVGQPVRLSDTPSALVAPPPENGEHTDEILAEFGLRPRRDRKHSAATAPCDRRPSGAGAGCRLASPRSVPVTRGRDVGQSQRAGRLVQRRVHAGARGAHPVPRHELGLWRRLLRHDAQLRPPAVQGEGACRAAVPLAQIPAHRPGLRAAAHGRAHRGAVRAQPPSPRARRRLLGRAAHQPRRQGGAGRQPRSSRAEHRARMRAAAARPAGEAVPGGHPRRRAVAPARAAGFAHPAGEDPQLPQPRRREPGGAVASTPRPGRCSSTSTATSARAWARTSSW